MTQEDNLVISEDNVKVAEIAKALAHPARLYIIDLLNDGEMCVCDITAKVSADISTVSRHLDKLRQAGIIERRKEGTKVLYTLQMHCLSGVFTCVDNVLRQQAEKLGSLVS